MRKPVCFRQVANNILVLGLYLHGMGTSARLHILAQTLYYINFELGATY
jgi:hypothetical protein